MKHLLILASLALASCTAATAPIAVGQPAAPTAATGVVAQAGKVILTGERAFAAAELAYITAADGVGRLADNDVITGATATQVRRWNATARGLLVKGKATADAVEKARFAAELFGIADRLDALDGSN